MHFYEDDASFERLWNNPQKYIPILKKYKGVITPDFSDYRDMPLVMQQWNTYRNRAIGCRLQDNGIPTIANVRWGDKRTFPFCCAGTPKNSIIAIGSHGCIKLLQKRPYFINGLDYSVKTLQPMKELDVVTTYFLPVSEKADIRKTVCLLFCYIGLIAADYFDFTSSVL